MRCTYQAAIIIDFSTYLKCYKSIYKCKFVMLHWLYLPDEEPSGSICCKTDEVDVADVCVLEDCLPCYFVLVSSRSIQSSISFDLEEPVVLETTYMD